MEQHGLAGRHAATGRPAVRPPEGDQPERPRHTRVPAPANELSVLASNRFVFCFGISTAQAVTVADQQTD